MSGMQDRKARRARRFIGEYLIDLNASAAIRRAGFKGKNARNMANRLMRLPEVKAAIDLAEKARAEKVGVTAEYVLRTIHETVERCRQAAPVLDREGRPVMVETPDGRGAVAYVFDAKNVLKGAELLARHLGMLTDKVKIDETVTHRHVVEVPVVAASPDEWQRQIREEQARGVLPGLSSKLQ